MHITSSRISRDFLGEKTYIYLARSKSDGYLELIDELISAPPMIY